MKFVQGVNLCFTKHIQKIIFIINYTKERELKKE
jgi:hypothetical protein